MDYLVAFSIFRDFQNLEAANIDFKPKTTILDYCTFSDILLPKELSTNLISVSHAIIYNATLTEFKLQITI